MLKIQASKISASNKNVTKWFTQCYNTKFLFKFLWVYLGSAHTLHLYCFSTQLILLKIKTSIIPASNKDVKKLFTQCYNTKQAGTELSQAQLKLEQLNFLRQFGIRYCQLRNPFCKFCFTKWFLLLKLFCSSYTQDFAVPWLKSYLLL